MLLARGSEFEKMLIASDDTDYLIEGYYFDAVDLSRLRKEYLDERRIALEASAEPIRKKRDRSNHQRCRVLAIKY